MTGNVGLLRALKGAPVSVVMALVMARGAVGPRELARWTGYSEKPVRSALEVLSELGVAERHGRYSGWMLTARGRQMVLGEGEGREGEFLPLGSSSSSSYIEGDRVLPGTTTTTTREREILRFPAEWREVLDGLVRFCGMSGRRAVEVVEAARRRDWLPAQVEYEALRWLAYTQDEDRATINNVGAFVAARLESGARVPYGYRPADGFRLEPRLIGARRRWNEELGERYSGREL